MDFRRRPLTLALFDKFIANNAECAKKVQEAGNKLDLGNYLKPPWQITDTLPIYDKPGVIPGQTDPKLNTPRNYFDAHPGWAATRRRDLCANSRSPLNTLLHSALTH